MKLALAALVLPVVAATSSVKRFQLNLDDPPRQRWRDLALEVRDRFREFFTGNETPMQWDVFDPKLLDQWLEHQVETLDPEFREELMGWVDVLDSPQFTLKTMILRNARYELGITQAISGCTGIVAAMPNGTVVHGRNMDLTAVDINLLRKVTLVVTFMKGGKPLMKSILHPGQIGINTGIRYDGYSMEQNSRKDDRCRDKDNLIREYAESARQGGKLMMLELRRIMQDTADFEQVVEAVQARKWIVPQYFIMAGAAPWQGAVITVDHSLSHQPPQVRRMAKLGPQFLVQTNDDSWLPPTDDRRGAGMSLLATRMPEVASGLVAKIMRSPPICNRFTMYTFVCENHINRCKLDMSDCPMNSNSLGSTISFNGVDALPHDYDWNKTKTLYHAF
mmetsp:Transcript_55743/g.158285  ORF Transcript_55743/g.158285 Transcript_55743/m.158285 type:complete len:392 (-) Transcript_55743:52-1227(-)